MHEQQRRLRRILILGAGLLPAYGAIGIDLLSDARAPGAFFYGGLAMLAVLGFFAARWLLTGVEALTASAGLDSLPLLLLLWILAVAATAVVLPLVLLVMVLRYGLGDRSRP